jgi:hypothetical protein
VSTTGTAIEDLKERIKRKEDSEILNWLSILTPEEKQRRVLTEYQKDTGNYLFTSQKWIRWQAGMYRILWCNGPGQ